MDKELDVLSVALCTPTNTEFKKSQKCKKHIKSVESVKKLKVKTKLCFERYRAAKLKRK